MTIIEALRTENIRLSNGERWLVADEDWFYVMERKPRKTWAITLIETNDEAEAVRVLLEGL